MTRCTMLFKLYPKAGQARVLGPAVAVLALLTACGSPPETPEVPRRMAFQIPEVPQNLLDLTHSFDAETIYWPTETRGFELEKVAEGMTEKGYFYSANRFCSAEHGGTHLDAPFHFSATGATVEALPLERLVGRGMVVDVSEKAHQDRDYLVGIEDFEIWEKLHGPMPEGAIVLLRTGFGHFWGDREKYLGTARLGSEAVPELHFPGLHPEAAAWLRDERRITAVGIDTASIDHGPSSDFGAHVALAAGNIPIFENVASLDSLPDDGFLVAALPMKIAGGSGAPLRIIALW